MAYIAGLFIIDAPASALNNAGQERGAKTDNIIVVKKIQTPSGTYPYISAQALRYWIRTTLEQDRESGWVHAPVYRETKIAYTAANPITYWDDDLFGYMRAPKDPPEGVEPLEKDREITRVSPFRVSTMVSTTPVRIVEDFGVMARKIDISKVKENPIPYEHEFYRAHMLALFSIDLTCAGTFFDGERAGFRNLDKHRREQAQEKKLDCVTVRGQKAFRLPLSERQRRVATLVRAIGKLDGGARQTLHYTDVAPSLFIAAVLANGNHPFVHVFGSSRTKETEFRKEAFEEAIEVFKKDFLSKIHIGWAKGFLDEERGKLPQNQILKQVVHPREAVENLAKELEDEKNGDWYG